MGCITADIRRIGGITANIYRDGGITADIERKGGITADLTLVCCIDKGIFLRVKPVEVQWVNVDLSAEYQIHTPLAWNLE